jgi:hypothetical protein
MQRLQIDWRAIFPGWLLAVASRYIFLFVNLLITGILEALEKKGFSFAMAANEWRLLIKYVIIAFPCLAVAGLITGRLSRNRPILNATVMGILFILGDIWFCSMKIKLTDWSIVLGTLAVAPGALLGGYIAKTRRSPSFQDHPHAELPKKAWKIILALGIGIPPVVQTATAAFYVNEPIFIFIMGQLMFIMMNLPAVFINVLTFALFLFPAQWRLRTSPKDLPAILLPRKFGLMLAFGVFCSINIAIHTAYWIHLYGSKNISSTVGIGFVLYLFWAVGSMPLGYGVGWLIGRAAIRLGRRLE